MATTNEKSLLTSGQKPRQDIRSRFTQSKAREVLAHAQGKLNGASVEQAWAKGVLTTQELQDYNEAMAIIEGHRLPAME